MAVLRRQTVELSWVLDAVALAREGNLKGGASGTCPCTRQAETTRVSWELEENQNHEEFLRLSYRASRPGAAPRDHSQWIYLERTQTGLKLERVWFACPCCERRVRKLYLPPAEAEFRCLSCHRLSYRSRQRRPNPVEQMMKLERQLARLPVRSERSLKKRQEIERLRERYPFLLGLLLSIADLFGEEPDYARRGRGRPSRAKERERARLRREVSRSAACNWVRQYSSSCPTLAVSRVRRPPAGMASRAFRARFKSTCSN